MKHIIRILMLSVFLYGCSTPVSYVDQQYSKTKYEDITRLVEPLKLKVNVVFQRNGEPLPAVDNELRGHVERVLRATGVVVPVSTGTTGELDVTVNNVADLAEAAAKGFGTGLTFGVAKSNVTDFYELKASLRIKEKVIYHNNYKHAIHSSIGLHDEATSAQGMTPSAAFGKVVEDFILNFIQDFQQANPEMPSGA